MLWSAIHSHQHGDDAYLFQTDAEVRCPDDSAIIAVIGIKFEQGETLTVAVVVNQPSGDLGDSVPFVSNQSRRSVPVIFELDGAGEATGQVLFYCSNDCALRDPLSIDFQFGTFITGKSVLPDDVRFCDFCGTKIEDKK